MKLAIKRHLFPANHIGDIIKRHSDPNMIINLENLADCSSPIIAENRHKGMSVDMAHIK